MTSIYHISFNVVCPINSRTVKYYASYYLAQNKESIYFPVQICDQGNGSKACSDCVISIQTMLNKLEFGDVIDSPFCP